MAAVRRLSCDCDVTAIRVGTKGVPLSMGRTRRTVTPSQWLALVVGDKGCVFPACQYPAPTVRRITSNTGQSTATPTWRTSPSSAIATTTQFITRAGKSEWGRRENPN
jgi:hypothetical protein